jgi:hypothetical protein
MIWDEGEHREHRKQRIAERERERERERIAKWRGLVIVRVVQDGT